MPVFASKLCAQFAITALCFCNCFRKLRKRTASGKRKNVPKKQFHGRYLEYRVTHSGIFYYALLKRNKRGSATPKNPHALTRLIPRVPPNQAFSRAAWQEKTCTMNNRRDLPIRGAGIRLSEGAVDFFHTQQVGHCFVSP